MSNKFQNEDFKTQAELEAAGGTKAQLLNDTKIYVTANGIAKTLDQAILDGDIGGSGGVGGVDIFATDTADKSTLAQYTQSGLEIITTPVILHGTKSFRLIHQAAATRSFSKTIPVDRKFRGKAHTFEIDVVSSALSANLTLLLRDETAGATQPIIAASQPITTGSQTVSCATNTNTTLSGFSTADFSKLKLGQLITGPGIPSGTTIIGLSPNALTATISNAATTSATATRTVSALTTKRTFGFYMPEGCTSFSWTISALQEANSPETYLDDIVIQLVASALSSTTITVPKNNDFGPINMGALTISATTTAPTKGTVITDRVMGSRISNRLVADFQYSQSAGGSAGSGEYLYSLPNGLQFDASSITPFSGDISSTFGIVSPDAQRAYVGSGHIAAGSGTTRGRVSLFAYSATQFRVVAELTFTSYRTQDNGYYALTGSFGYNLHLDAPIAGWLANETETKTIPLTTAVLYQQPDSFMRIVTPVGNGSTNTFLRRFTSVSPGSKGDAFTYNQSTTLGDSVVVNYSGIYTLGYTDNFGAVSIPFGISVNYTSNTAPQSIPQDSRLIMNYSENNTDWTDTVPWTGYLNAGDVLRFHVGASSLGTNITQGQVTLAFQGSMKILNPSLDQKIEIPTHELRFEGASSRGTTNTGIVKFDTIAKIRGDAWDIENTAANGTTVTMKKAGRLTSSANLRQDSAGGVQLYISINQTGLTGETTNTNEMIATSRGGTAAGQTQFSTMTGSIDVKVGDKIRVSCGLSPVTDTRTNYFSLHLLETSIGVALSNVLPTFTDADSAVRVQSSNGYGSINTFTKRFSNVLENKGTDILYVDSGTLGASFQILNDGEYHINYTDSLSAVNNIAIVKNGNGAANVPNQNGANLLAVDTVAVATQTATASWSGYLLKGDIIRAQTDGAAVSGTGFGSFNISKVGKPNITSVDVTPFANIKMQDDPEVILLSTTYNTTFTATANTETTIPFSVISASKDLYSIEANGVRIKKTGRYKLKLAAEVFGNNEQATLTFYINGNRINPLTLHQADVNGTGSYGSYFEEQILSLTVGDLVKGSLFVASSTRAARSAQMSLVQVSNLTSDSVITPVKQQSSDDMPLVWSSVAITVNSPIGTYNTYNKPANTGDSSTLITSTAPTQSLASMNINGIALTAIPWATGGTPALPQRFDIQVGTGRKGFQFNGFGALGKLTELLLDLYPFGTTTIHGLQKAYNPTTGILTIDVGGCYTGANTARSFLTKTMGGGTYTTAYITFDTGTTASLASIPSLTRKVAIIKDIRSIGVAGGSSSTSYVARNLNSLYDPSGIVKNAGSFLGTDNTSNTQILLDPGKYVLKCTSSIYSGSSLNSKDKLQNITAGTELATGQTVNAVAGMASENMLLHGFTLTSQSAISLFTAVSTAQATNGFGVNYNQAGTNTFVTIEVEKLD